MKTYCVVVTGISEWMNSREKLTKKHVKYLSEVDKVAIFLLHV